MKIVDYKNFSAIEYCNNRNQYHRLDGPAVEYISGEYKGYKCWCIDGDVHKEDGPAKIYQDGRKEYWFQGEWHRDIKTDKQWFKKVKNLNGNCY